MTEVHVYNVLFFIMGKVFGGLITYIVLTKVRKK